MIKGMFGGDFEHDFNNFKITTKYQTCPKTVQVLYQVLPILTNSQDLNSAS